MSVLRVTDATAAAVCRALGRYLENRFGDGWGERMEFLAQQCSFDWN